MRAELEQMCDTILRKIDEGTVTASDFQLLLDSMPETVRDRVRRRMNPARETTKMHRDNATGHTKLELPTQDARIQPKREREGSTQRLGRGRLGHRHSARTQERTMPHRFSEAIEFIRTNIGKDVSTLQFEHVNKPLLAVAANRLMSVPNINRDWLSQVCAALKVR